MLISIKPILIVLIVFFPLFSQEAQTDESEIIPTTPCEHSVLQKAQIQGLNSLSPVEIPQYWIRLWQCKQYTKKMGKEVDFKTLYEQKELENYREAEEISGIGSSYAIVITIILFYSYYGYFMR